MDEFIVKPTPKQKKFILDTAKFSCFSGAFGCVAGETKIFNPLTGKHERIDSVDELHVYTKTEKSGYTVWYATRPKKYRKARLYEVATERGRKITVTNKHKFFTKDGWKRLSSLKQTSLPLLVYGGFHPLTILELFQSVLLSGASRLKKILLGLKYRCLAYFYQYDEQPHPSSGISQDASLLQVYAQERSLNCEIQDGHFVKSTYNHPYQSSTHAYKNDSSFHVDRHGEGEVDHNEQITFGSLWRTYQLKHLSLWLISLARRVYGSLLMFQGRFWTWYYNSTIRYEKVKSIKYIRTDYYYDLHVPAFNNYFAEGFINHNSGKTYGGCLRGLMLSGFPNNRGLIGRLCYDDQTEILTEKRGWQLFKDLLNTDKVATLHNGNELIYERPISYYYSPYDGEMIRIKNRNFNLLVTPEHKLWVRRRGNRDGSKTHWQMRQAQERYGKIGWEMKRNVETWNNGEESSEDYMEFLGFWFAEGWAKVKEKHGPIITITSGNQEYVEDLLDRNDFKYSKNVKEDGKCFNYNLRVSEKMRETCEKLETCGKALTKSIPFWIKNSSKKSLQAFLHGYIMGDGHYRQDKHDSTQAWTSSFQLANDIQEIGFKAGYTVTIYNRGIKKRKNSYGGKNPEYEITFLQRGFGRIEPKHWSKEQYSGGIYCVQVSSGLIYVRRRLGTKKKGGGAGVWSSNTYP